MAHLVQLFVQEGLEMNVVVAVVFCDGHSNQTFGPCQKNALGVSGNRHHFHPFSKAQTMKDHVLVVKVKEVLGVLHHGFCRWPRTLWKVFQGVLTILDLHHLPNRKRSIRSDLLDGFLQSAQSCLYLHGRIQLVALVGVEVEVVKEGFS